MMSGKTPLLEIEDLSVSFGSNEVVKAVSFQLHPGEVLGVVGESGSGKSVTTLALMGLLPTAVVRAKRAELSLPQSTPQRTSPPSGSPTLPTSPPSQFTPTQSPSGVSLLNLTNTELRKIRGRHLAMVFQEPMSSLNPLMRCGDQVAEVLLTHGLARPEEAKERALQWFERVQLPTPAVLYNRYPHELSGGQKQRVMIAMAMIAQPDILIADEPTTALDAHVQAEVIQLMLQLQREEGMAMIFISHDLVLMEHVASRVLVMRSGEIAEQGEVKTLFSNPQSPYTRGLLACRPQPGDRLYRLPTVDDFTNPHSTAEAPPSRETTTTRHQRHERLYAHPPLFQAREITKTFPNSEKPAVDSVSFDLYRGETLGLVGGSGSGKTTLSRILLGLTPATSGSWLYRDQNLLTLSTRDFLPYRRTMQLVFQDPVSSLHPYKTIFETLYEPMRVHGILPASPFRRVNSRTEGRARAAALLEKVGLSADVLTRYPRELSGGQCQRVGIARALVLEPEFIICDESVSALDVSVQAQVLNLLNELKDQLGLTYLFIAHDLQVVRYMCDRILVMHDGKIVESGEADALYNHPQTEYTQKLLSLA